MKRKLIEVAWEITDTCNYNCVHCYNPRQRSDLSYDEVLRVLGELKRMKVEKIKFGGGEPLLRKDFLRILAEAIELDFDCNFSTNGFVITPSLVSEIWDTGLRNIQVSLDGGQEVHNKIRGNPLAYDRAVSAIEMFARAGFKVSVATTLMKINLGSLKDIFDACLGKGINRWRVMKYVPSCDLELTPSAEEYFKAHKELEGLRAMSCDFEVYIAREFNEVCEDPDRFDFQCFGGRSIMSIKANGDVSPCSYYPDLVVGNVVGKDVAGLWNSSEMIEFADEFYGDSNCEFYKTCQGGCKAARHYIVGDEGCDPYCWVKLRD